MLKLSPIQPIVQSITPLDIGLGQLLARKAKTFEIKRQGHPELEFGCSKKIIRPFLQRLFRDMFYCFFLLGLVQSTRDQGLAICF